MKLRMIRLGSRQKKTLCRMQGGRYGNIRVSLVPNTPQARTSMHGLARKGLVRSIERPMSPYSGYRLTKKGKRVARSICFRR